MSSPDGVGFSTADWVDLMPEVHGPSPDSGSINYINEDSLYVSFFLKNIDDIHKYNHDFQAIGILACETLQNIWQNSALVS